ncbi:hypothetical protein BJ085DRAFT_32331 [Dimargaris cristalligena]|uniref:Uncharacterized protein n=1 Tax=Dimargaris cristalligena TaxID=215637 RepID=A0A4P9ZST9_9FUNG|nr:hypothetical protein BJ085DRAFT_32331 [Dimargaris cristalligena]|eukprot:RKP36517.1 hypothetical protein BJ085DRAFT_32331 [Dimargaris cristalligena]
MIFPAFYPSSYNDSVNNCDPFTVTGYKSTHMPSPTTIIETPAASLSTTSDDQWDRAGLDISNGNSGLVQTWSEHTVSEYLSTGLANVFEIDWEEATSPLDNKDYGIKANQDGVNTDDINYG